MENGQRVLLACIYISPGSSVAAVVTFMYKVLVLYVPEVAAIIRSDDDKKPIILTGDFNVDLLQKQKSHSLKS
ncbi:hypothetical protein TNCV_792541 [Trichonephila clavipes]|nr:hypothetical protein TNCV_792541 [Trichonephila clavipes]